MRERVASHPQWLWIVEGSGVGSHAFRTFPVVNPTITPATADGSVAHARWLVMAFYFVGVATGAIQGYLAHRVKSAARQGSVQETVVVAALREHLLTLGLHPDRDRCHGAGLSPLLRSMCGGRNGSLQATQRIPCAGRAQSPVSFHRGRDGARHGPCGHPPSELNTRGKDAFARRQPRRMVPDGYGVRSYRCRSARHRYFSSHTLSRFRLVLTPAHG